MPPLSAPVHRLPWLICLLWLAPLLPLTGCGGPTPQLVPAEGVLLLDGEPASDIAVQFLPDDVAGELRPSSYGVSDARGHFVLQTYEHGPGAVSGSHTVLLVDTLEERPEQGQPATRPPRLDGRSASVTGGLRAHVTAGGSLITIEASSGGTSPTPSATRR